MRLLVALVLACSTPAPPPPASPPVAAPAPAPQPAAPDPAWDVAGRWDAEPFAPGCVVSVLRYPSYPPLTSLECGDEVRRDLTLGTPTLAGTQLVVDVGGTARTLERRHPDQVKVLPSEAVVRAVAWWSSQRHEPANVESVHESSDFGPYGAGPGRTWVVAIETPRAPNTAVMPATQEIAVNVGTGQCAWIPGR